MKTRGSLQKSSSSTARRSSHFNMDQTREHLRLAWLHLVQADTCKLQITFHCLPEVFKLRCWAVEHVGQNHNWVETKYIPFTIFILFVLLSLLGFFWFKILKRYQLVIQGLKCWHDKSIMFAMQHTHSLILKHFHCT